MCELTNPAFTDEDKARKVIETSRSAARRSKAVIPSSRRSSSNMRVLRTAGRERQPSELARQRIKSWFLFLNFYFNAKFNG
jgi:hypothetical protein